MTTLNPYVSGASLWLRRLRWDLRLESWRARSRLRALRDIHVGKPAVVLCNGPSLLKVDFSLLRNTYTFGLNKINLMFNRSEFRPNCIVAVNPHVIEQNLDFYRTTDIPLFLDSGAQRRIGSPAHINFLHRANIRTFAQDVSFSVWEGHTVTYVALQIAFHMGFHRVALVGCDHSFAVHGPANAEVKAGEKDLSHFDPAYFPPGASWQLPDLRQSEVAYLLALDAYEKAGRKLVNATDGGRLELLPRQALSRFLAG